MSLKGPAKTVIMSKFEYFIDTDPGFGLGVNVPITSANSIDKTLNVDLSNVTNGLHTLYIRAKDNNSKWSHIFNRLFIKSIGDGNQTVITQIEYFYDTDPGFGQGNQVPITAAAQINKQFTANTTGLTTTNHTLYIRAKADNGRWSNAYYGTFSLVSTVLPVEFGLFTVHLDNGNGVLRWLTHSEYNVERFDIERSIDAIKFEKIDNVKAKGNSNSKTNYQYIDKNLSVQNKMYYYRLKSVDLDGKFTYSDIRSIQLEGNSKFKALVFPNPNDGYFNLVLDGNIDEKSPIFVTFMDVTGKIMTQFEKKDFKSGGLIEFDFSGWL